MYDVREREREREKSKNAKKIPTQQNTEVKEK